MKPNEPRYLPAALMLAAASLASADTPAPPPEAAQEPEGRPWLGVLLADAVDGGVRIVAVVPGGPAEGAGLRAGDLLLVLGDREVTDRAVVDRVLGTTPPGAAIEVRVLRDGRTVERALRLGRRPTPQIRIPPLPPPIERSAAAIAPLPSIPPLRVSVEGLLGAKLAPMSEELRTHYGAPAEAGVLVARVETDEPGARAGLRVGDVVTRACGVRVKSPRQHNPCLSLEPDADAVIEVVRARRPNVLKLPQRERYAGSPEPSVVAPLAPLAPAESVKELRIRLIEDEIARLERRLEELRQELERLR